MRHLIVRPRRAVALVALLAAVFAAGCATISLVESIESLLKQAKELLDARKYDEALAKLAEVIKCDAAQWKAYLYSALAYIGKGDWGHALASARDALTRAPDGAARTDVAKALLDGGRQALARSDYTGAASLLSEYVRQQPADWTAYLDAARAYLGKADWGQALALAREGLSRAPDGAARGEIAKALLDGGRQALGRNDFSGAAALLSEYVKQDPRDVSALLDLGKAHWNAGDRTQALDAFKKVLELAPTNAEARRFLLGN
jgi:tetratricopeptide (TPR) repeat protein